jgi:hypothetical protein
MPEENWDQGSQIPEASSSLVPRHSNDCSVNQRLNERQSEKFVGLPLRNENFCRLTSKKHQWAVPNVNHAKPGARPIHQFVIATDGCLNCGRLGSLAHSLHLSLGHYLKRYISGTEQI